MSYSLRVLLAEDHPQMREAIKSLLSRNCDVVGTVGRGDAVWDAVLQLQPDAVVLNVSMPGMGGLQLLPKLRQAFPTLAIVMLSNHTEPMYPREAQNRGADAYVFKDYAFEQLWPALEQAFLKRSPQRHARIVNG